MRWHSSFKEALYVASFVLFGLFFLITEELKQNLFVSESCVETGLL